MTSFELGALATREAIARMADAEADAQKQRHNGHNHDAKWVLEARESERAMREFAAKVRTTPCPVEVRR